MTEATPPRDIAIVGAGIIGVSCAHFLQRDGHRVTIFDPNDPGSGSSFGNAGLISQSSVMPSSTPGLVKRIPRMLMDPASPLVLQWQYVPRLLPWLAGFLANSSRARVERNCMSTAQLFRHVMDAYDTIIREVGCGDLIQATGSLKLFESEASFQASAFERAMMDRCDCRYDVLGSDEIRQLEPNLAPIFERALFIPDSRNILSPARLVEAIASSVRSRGGKFERAHVRNVAFDSGGKPVIETDSGQHAADLVIVAAGARSGALAKRLGAKVVLDAERGYHVMLPQPERSIGRYLQFAESRISLSPKEGGLRMTSIVELASVDAPPDFRRIRRLTGEAARVLPGLKAEELSIWQGARPSLPDNVPVLARSPRHDSVYFAFGHSHLGMTMGPVSGRIVADLVAGRDPGLDMTPYGPVRPFL
ncbi:MAG: FAD-binding oxidoreductase [Gammaproteobacteria bacterium]|jgi:D-amino-acid dehydrogenase